MKTHSITKPRAILFDYGGTLLYEPMFDPLKVNTRFLDFVIDTHGISPEEYNECASRTFNEIRAFSSDNLEVHEHLFLKYMADRFGFELSAPLEVIEREMFNSTECQYTPGVKDMLQFMRDRGIKTGVVSNLCWSGQALRNRLNEMFPEHKFDCVITSSEYFYRKPCKQIYESAIRKIGVDAKDIWFCGNSLNADVIGPHRAGLGLFPIWYENRDIVEIGHITDNDGRPNLDFDYLHINDWSELTQFLCELA